MHIDILSRILIKLNDLIKANLYFLFNVTSLIKNYNTWMIADRKSDVHVAVHSR